MWQNFGCVCMTYLKDSSEDETPIPDCNLKVSPNSEVIVIKVSVNNVCICMQFIG